MAEYELNAEAVRHVRELIDARQYVLDSDWGDSQPTRRRRTSSSRSIRGTSTPRGTSG